MRRDMDLIRELLLKLEAIELPPGAVTRLDASDKQLALEAYSADQINRHLTLIQEAGLLRETRMNPMVGIGFSGLSWSGHDFLDSVRDPEVWAKTKKGAAAAGGFTMELLQDLAKGFLKKQIEEFTGVKL